MTLLKWIFYVGLAQLSKSTDPSNSFLHQLFTPSTGKTQHAQTNTLKSNVVKFRTGLRGKTGNPRWRYPADLIFNLRPFPAIHRTLFIINLCWWLRVFIVIFKSNLRGFAKYGSWLWHKSVLCNLQYIGAIRIDIIFLFRFVFDPTLSFRISP